MTRSSSTQSRKPWYRSRFQETGVVRFGVFIYPYHPSLGYSRLRQGIVMMFLDWGLTKSIPVDCFLSDPKDSTPVLLELESMRAEGLLVSSILDGDVSFSLTDSGRHYVQEFDAALVEYEIGSFGIDRGSGGFAG